MSSSYERLQKELDKGIIQFKSVHTNGNLFRVDFSVNNPDAYLWLDDEYNDITAENSPLTWLMCLYAIETYQESDDITTWAKEYNLPLSDEVIAYYKSLPDLIKLLQDADLDLDPTISYYDYHLGAGDIDDLRKKTLINRDFEIRFLK